MYENQSRAADKETIYNILHCMQQHTSRDSFYDHPITLLFHYFIVLQIN